MLWRGFQKPKRLAVDGETLTDTFGKFSAQPFERGFGTTIGNALRRTLLSSIEGAAVTAIRIEGVLHEFQSISGVVEDATDIILNLKQVPFKLTGDGPKALYLRADQPGVVTSGMIEADGDVEILDKNIYIATLSEGGKLDMEMRLKRGRGYVSADKNKRSATIGVIPVDSIFSPVRRVTFTVEPVRVEQSTDFDSLVLDIETDGSLTPREALASAGDTLRTLVGLVADLEEAPQGLELGDVSVASSGSPDLDLRIEDLDLSERPRNCLKRAQVNTIGELVERTPDELLGITNFGQKSLDEVLERLDERGLSLRTKD